MIRLGKRILMSLSVNPTMSNAKQNYYQYIDEIYRKCLRQDNQEFLDNQISYVELYDAHEKIYDKLNDDCNLIDIYNAWKNTLYQRENNPFYAYLYSSVFLPELLKDKELNTGDTLLLYVTRWYDLDTLTQILSHPDCDTELLSQINDDGDNVFTLAARLGHADIRSGHKNIVNLLLEHKAIIPSIITHTDNLGHNALMLAVKFNHKSSVTVILSDKLLDTALLGQCNHSGHDALMLAITYGRFDMAIELIEHDFKYWLTQPIFNGENLLIWAINSKNFDIVDAILSHPECDSEVLIMKDKYGYTALMLAIRKGMENVTNQILELPSCSIEVLVESNDDGENIFELSDSDRLLEVIESKPMSPIEGRKILNIAMTTDNALLAEVTVHHPDMTYEKLEPKIEKNTLSNSPKVRRIIEGKYREEMKAQRDNKSIGNLKKQGLFSDSLSPDKDNVVSGIKNNPSQSICKK